MRIRDITLTAAMTAVVTVPTAAHAAPGDAWRYVYFTPVTTWGDFEASGSHEVWHITHKPYGLWPTVSRWAGGSTGQTHSLPGLPVPTFLGTNEIQDIDAAGPNEVWVKGYSVTTIGGGQRYLARWDGTRWTQVTPPSSSSNDYTSDVLAAGSGGVWYAAGRNLARWNGSSWTVVETLDSSVEELHSFPQGGALARTRSNVMWKWDGNAWQELPGEWPAAAQVTGPDSAWYADTGGLRIWNGASWRTVPYEEDGQALASATAISESDGLWVSQKLQSGPEMLWRWKNEKWTYYPDTPDQVKQVAVDGDGRIWAVDRITRYITSGSSQVPEPKGRLLRFNADEHRWDRVSVPEADYRMINLPGSDRLYAYGRNHWLGTDHITTNAEHLP